MTRDELIGILLIAIVVGGANVTFIFMQQLTELNEDYITIDSSPQTVDLQSYIMAKGEFDFVDMYTWAEADGSDGYRLHAHIVHSQESYPIHDALNDINDRSDRVGSDILWRILLWICVDGNMTEHRFLIADDVFYDDIIFRGISFTLYINE